MTTEGEAWAAGALAELRSRRYRPLAWIDFLGSSFRRARESVDGRGYERRQELALAVAGAAVWLGVALLGRPCLALAGVIWWALVLTMVDWHLGMLEDAQGRRQRGLGLANLLSIVRAGVVPALPVLPSALLATVLIPAGVADGIDGRIARARGEETRLGLWLDGGVDGFVLGAAAIGAARHGVLPVWAAALVLGRHAVQWLLVTLAFFLHAEAPAREGFVSGKVPGLVLFTGLALAALHVPGGTALVVLGALGGLVTFGLTLARSQRTG
ncbi:MAG: CDP-alcohol phosphatidyltransferase family protein [Gaiellaceae bacterium]